MASYDDSSYDTTSYSVFSYDFLLELYTGWRECKSFKVVIDRILPFRLILK